ncbi:MAG: hypothetical protein U1F77_09990 [Kiritimatiellia bacterium]
MFPGTPFCAGATIPLTWYGGSKKPDESLVQFSEGRHLPGGGSIFIGTEGQMVLPHVGGPQLYPLDKFKGLARPDLPKHIDHYHTWIDHVFAGEKTATGFTIPARWPRRCSWATSRTVSRAGPLNGMRRPCASPIWRRPTRCWIRRTGTAGRVLG